MSAAGGFPDWQRITQWLGSPLVSATGLVIGAGTHTDGPLQVSNFASVIVALKAIGGNVTVTLKQTVPAGPSSLVLTESVVVAAGATLFEAFVLFGSAVELDLTGSVAGTSVDYAFYGSNTTTNAQVITQATIDVQHNDVLVAAEPTLDFEDDGTLWTVTDDAPNTRVKIAVNLPPGIILPFGAAVAPTGYLLCHGQAVLRATYAGLFAAIGVVYGAGDGVTTFNLPDLQGRSIVGLGTNAAVNAIGGNDGVAVASRRGTKHRHTPHSHTVGGSANIAVNAGNSLTPGAGFALTFAAMDTKDGGSGTAADPLDGGAYLVLEHIIKT